MSRGKKVALMVLLIVVLGYPTMTRADGDKKGIPLIPEDVEVKLGKDIITEIQNGSKTIEAIIACYMDTPLDYAERAVEIVENLDIIRNWHRSKIFRANVTLSQLYKIGRLPFVRRIDNNTYEQLVSINYARAYTRVNELQYYLPDLDGDADGSKTTYSKDDIVIAILDTGIDIGHYDLDGGKVIGWVDLAGDENGDPHDTPYDDGEGLAEGHGTHCASIAAGSGDAHSNYRGVARYAALVGVKMLNRFGGATPEETIEALEWVGDNRHTHGIEIASLSWGFSNYGEYDSVAQAADALVYFGNVVVVAAAGNSGYLGSDTISPPGTAKWVITVGSAIDPAEGGWLLADYSGRGPCDDDRIKPDILAPGTDIKAAEAGTVNQYVEKSGTSMATPFVAGVVALLLDYDPLLRYDYDANHHPDIKQLLMASAEDMPSDPFPGVDNDYGAGRVDALSEYQFIVRDISSWSTDAPLVISYQDTTWNYGNEPLWVRDNNYRSDWYKVRVYSHWFVYAAANGDPDLLLRVYIYDKYMNLKASSSTGNSRNVGYWSTYNGYYYIRVQSQQYTGDYYDIAITTTAS